MLPSGPGSATAARGSIGVYLVGCEEQHAVGQPAEAVELASVALTLTAVQLFAEVAED